MPEQPLISVDAVTTIFKARQQGAAPVVAVDDVSLALPADRAGFLTIVGESGSGKSTLARNMLGLTQPSQGQVRYLGRDIATLSGRDLLDYRRDVQPVFQDPYAVYNPFYRIDRVLHLPLRKFKLAQGKDEAQAKIEAALTAVDLRPGDVLGRYPHQLSGGERQRVMLARIYLIRPRLIVADEPLSMIDASLRTLFLNILLDFREQHGISCIHITHNLATAYYLGGELMVMCKGRVIEQGDMDTIIAQPAHPYTQQLVAAVPNPDPTQRRTATADSTTFLDTTELSSEAHACVYAQRCPHVMPICHEQRPDQRRQNAHQQAACFLYDAS